MHRVRHLIWVLRDQLDLEAAAFDGFDPAQDAVWMAEAYEESTHVWSSKQRITLYLSALRHFAQGLRDAGRPLHYHQLDDTGAAADLDSLEAKLQADMKALAPTRVVMTAPAPCCQAPAQRYSSGSYRSWAAASCCRPARVSTARCSRARRAASRFLFSWGRSRPERSRSERSR